MLFRWLGFWILKEIVCKAEGRGCQFQPFCKKNISLYANTCQNYPSWNHHRLNGLWFQFSSVSLLDFWMILWFVMNCQCASMPSFFLFLLHSFQNPSIKSHDGSMGLVYFPKLIYQQKSTKCTWTILAFGCQMVALRRVSVFKMLRLKFGTPGDHLAGQFINPKGPCPWRFWCKHPWRSWRCRLSVGNSLSR